MTHGKSLWCWEGLGAGGEGDDRGLDGWMASLTRWTWVWVNSGSWWWTGRPGVLQFMGSQRVGHDWATDLIWSDLMIALLEGDRAIWWWCWLLSINYFPHPFFFSAELLIELNSSRATRKLRKLFNIRNFYIPQLSFLSRFSPEWRNWLTDWSKVRTVLELDYIVKFILLFYNFTI